MKTAWNRRRFYAAMSYGAIASVLSLRRADAAEPPPEVTTIRLAKLPVICFAPLHVCQELLRAEGFTDVRYVDVKPVTYSRDLGRGEFDFAANVLIAHVGAIDAGAQSAILSGVHAGGYELFGHEGVRGIADLKGKRVGLTAPPDLIQVMAAYAAARSGGVR
jgi:NitT/TauT family transport system substrate-binding protein